MMRMLIFGKPPTHSVELQAIDVGQSRVQPRHGGRSRLSWRRPVIRQSRLLFSHQAVGDKDHESEHLQVETVDGMDSPQDEVGETSFGGNSLADDVGRGFTSGDIKAYGKEGNPHGTSMLHRKSMDDSGAMMNNPSLLNNSELGYTVSKRQMLKNGSFAGHKSNSVLHFSSTSVAAHPPVPKKLAMTATDQAFLCLGFIAVALSGSISALLLMAIPTLRAMKKAAESVEKLADTAREELPGTMAALRLSGMEISDLTMELSDLSQDIGEGLRSSARAVQAAEDGLRRMGSFATNSTLTLLQTHATLPVEAVKPAAAAAAQTTRQAIENARKMLEELAILNFVVGWVNWGGTANKEGSEARKEPRSEMATTGESTVVLVQSQRMNAEALLKGDARANGQAVVRAPNQEE